MKTVNADTFQVLGATGLSMSHASSVSNLCNQAATEINRTIQSVNNASKTLKYDNTIYTLTEGVKLPADIVMLIVRKGQVHALQAYIMEGVNAKTAWLNNLRHAVYEYDVDAPERPAMIPLTESKTFTEQDVISTFTKEQVSEYLYAEAMAAHIGQFIHKDGKLTQLRNELPLLEPTAWHSITKDKMEPVTVTKHHTPGELLTIHEELAGLHRIHEMRVNYYKALIKNLLQEMSAAEAKRVADINAESSQKNNLAHQEFMIKYTEWSNAKKMAQDKFEAEREKEINRIAQLKITVPEALQPLLDEFINKLNIVKE